MEKKEMKAALFDLDGVVFDTEPQYTIFWGAQCREFHPEHPGLEHEIKGQTLVQIYDAWFSGPLTEKQSNRWIISLLRALRTISISCVARV